MAYALIQDAEAGGWTADLFAGAARETPGNPALLALAQKVPSRVA